MTEKDLRPERIRSAGEAQSLPDSWEEALVWIQAAERAADFADSQRERPSGTVSLAALTAAGSLLQLISDEGLQKMAGELAVELELRAQDEAFRASCTLWGSQALRPELADSLLEIRDGLYQSPVVRRQAEDFFDPSGQERSMREEQQQEETGPEQIQPEQNEPKGGRA